MWGFMEDFQSISDAMLDIKFHQRQRLPPPRSARQQILEPMRAKGTEGNGEEAQNGSNP